MKLTFEYDLEKDTENFLKSFTSVNSKKPTKLQEFYTAQIGELDVPKVPVFLDAQGINTTEKLQEIESNWKNIETKVINKMERLFSISIQNITAFLSTNSRCTYNIENNYFFVYMNGKHPNGTIAHELLHFYTWHAFYDELTRKGVSKEKYNDVKESLTEILNTDFSDLLQEYKDQGYTQHHEMRAKIRQMRQEGKDIREIVNSVIV